MIPVSVQWIFWCYSLLRLPLVSERSYFLFSLPQTRSHLNFFLTLFQLHVHTPAARKEASLGLAFCFSFFFFVTSSALHSHFHTNKKRRLRDLKVISHSFQRRPSLIEPDPECNRVIWFPSRPRRLIERRKKVDGDSVPPYLFMFGHPLFYVAKQWNGNLWMDPLWKGPTSLHPGSWNVQHMARPELNGVWGGMSCLL